MYKEGKKINKTEPNYKTCNNSYMILAKILENLHKILDITITKVVNTG